MNDLGLMLLQLLCILGALWMLAYWLKGKSQKGKSLFQSKNASLVVKERLALGQQQMLVLVQIEQKRLLLGVTAHQITVLSELAQQEEAKNGQHSAT